MDKNNLQATTHFLNVIKSITIFLINYSFENTDTVKPVLSDHAMKKWSFIADDLFIQDEITKS